MPTAFGRAVERVRSAIGPDDLPDAALLARYRDDRDADAFAALVRRHAAMVYATCRRVTGDCHLADDAFQATFLVLVRRANDVRPADAVGRFLYGVARRSALEARTLARRRLRRERPSAKLPDRGVEPAGWSDLPGVLDEELRRLPAKYRELLVEHDLLGRPRAELTRAFRVPDGTLSSRLAAARKMLAGRLLKRGVSLALPLVATPVVAAHPGVVGPAAEFGRAAGGAVPPGPAALAARILRAMTVSQFLRSAAGFALVAGLFAAGVALAPAAADDAKKAAPAKPSGPGRIVFLRHPHVTAIDPDGKNAKDILDWDGDFSPDDTKLSPDGKRVAFLVSQPDTGGRNSKPRKLYVRGVGEKGQGTDLGVQAMTLAWSPDGSKIVATDFDDGPPDKVDRKTTTVVVTVATKATEAVNLPADHIVTDWTAGDLFLTSRMTAAEDAPDKPGIDLYLMNRDGSEHKPVRVPGQRFAHGRVSPDGKRILAVMAVPAEKPKPVRVTLAVIDVAAGTAAPLKEFPENGEPMGFCWSPDGKRIAYTWRQVHADEAERRETETQLVVCDADGANPKVIASATDDLPAKITIGPVDWR